MCYHLQLPGPHCHVEYDMDNVQQAIRRTSKDKWWTEACAKPKLRSYVQFKDQANPTKLTTSNLPRYHRSLLAKLSCGILPLEIETRRFSGTKAE